jgi:peptide/nickel transport system substrate-binding protein
MSPRTRPLRNLLLRKALNYAVNKEELKKYAFKGNADEMKGMLTEKSGVDLTQTRTYDWNIPKARELMEEAGYGEGLKMKLLYHEKDYLLAQFLRRFFSLLKIEVEIQPMDWESFVRHVSHPNTREACCWEDEDWWITICSNPSYSPEVMGGWLEWGFHSGAAWQTFPVFLMEPLDTLYHQVLKTKDRDKRFQIYRKANEYIADQALQLFTMAPIALYGVNEELEFIPHPSQYLYLDHSWVTDNHWSLRGKSN